MPFALIVVGLVLLITASRDKHEQLFTLLKGDFTGPNNFVYWFVAILTIGAIGYIPRAKPFSNAMLVLVVLILVLKRGDSHGVGGGLFERFTEQLKSTAPAQPTTSQTQQPRPLDIDLTKVLTLPL